MNNFCVIGIVENDSDMFISLKEGEVVLTNNFQDILTFKSLEDAKSFAKQKLDEHSCYDIVNVKISIHLEQIDAINY